MAEAPVRILVLVGPATGGIGAHAAALAGDVAESAPEAVVAVVCPEITASRFAWRVPVERAWPSGRPLELWRRWRRVRELVSTADVVHAHGHQAGLLALAAAARARPRPAVAISWHNAVLASGWRGRLLALGERFQARRADLVTGASLDLVERAVELGARDAQLAAVAAPRAGEPVADVDGARERLRAELGIDLRSQLVLTVSRIAPQKDLEVLVKAARILHTDPESARRLPGPVVWLVVGDGDARLAALLGERAAASTADLRFLGAREDVPQLLAAADLFVLTSRWEARALVVQEAMAAGVPVVVSAVGGLPELVAEAGMLVRAGDARGFATAVGGLLADPARRSSLASAGRRRFAELPVAADITRSWQTRYALLARSTRGLR